MRNDLQHCIRRCQQCHEVCLSTAMTHCLDAGGEYVEKDHFRLMMSCAEICATSARLMLMESRWHPAICAVCAEVCSACAADCERLGGMDACVGACRECEESCRLMAA